MTRRQLAISSCTAVGISSSSMLMRSPPRWAEYVRQDLDNVRPHWYSPLRIANAARSRAQTSAVSSIAGLALIVARRNLFSLPVDDLGLEPSRGSRTVGENRLWKLPVRHALIDRGSRQARRQ